jgi:predicted transglutaminase-like cysteine proteinase
MTIKTAVGAALLVAAFQATPAVAKETASLGQGQAAGLFTVAYGETLPPVGYVNFCAANKGECESYNVGEKMATSRIAMSPDRWNTLYQINTYVNEKIKPLSDQDQYGELERWVYPTNAGDCEDFVLMKKRALEKLGVPAKSLQITVVLDERSEGHAVLTVATEEGDYILDNRSNDILLWNDTQYTFLKRQSDESPRKWVALLKKPDTASSVASGSGN